MSLPQLTINRSFMAEFLDADPPCFGLGMVELGDIRCALVALCPEQPIPRHVTAGGFAFGHSLLGGDGCQTAPASSGWACTRCAGCMPNA